jgi:hypothetical protein
MIVTELYKGQGFGNQLWSYATLRSLAEYLNCDYGVQSPWRFKGKAFLKLDMGRKVFGISTKFPTSNQLPFGVTKYFRELKVVNAIEGYEITPFDENLLKISDGTKFDGYFQSERLIKNYQSSISEWFKVEAEPNNYECLINIRGGEYTHYETLVLQEKYYRDAIKWMRENFGIENFGIVTDDCNYSSSLLPEIPILSKTLTSYSSLGEKIFDDFGSLQNAKNLILSNSSFSWWGAWTNQNVKRMGNVIAPKYWARHNSNDGFWSLGDVLTENWKWLDTQGKFSSYTECYVENMAFKQSDKYKLTTQTFQ